MHPSEETLLAKVFVPSHIRRNLVVPKEIEKVLELEIVGMPFHGPASDNNARFRFANRERTLFFSSSEHLFPLTSPCAVTASCIVWKALNNLNTYVVLAEPHYGVVKPACTVVPTHASATTALGKAYRGTSIVFAALVLFYPPVFFNIITNGRTPALNSQNCFFFYSIFNLSLTSQARGGKLSADYM